MPNRNRTTFSIITTKMQQKRDMFHVKNNKTTENITNYFNIYAMYITLESCNIVQ